MEKFKMILIRIRIFLTFLFLLVGLFCLFFYPELLGIKLMDSFPLGTLVSWITLILMPLFFYLLIPQKDTDSFNRKSRKTIQLVIFLAIIWGVFSYFLSGNWAFIFTNSTLMYVWLGYTGFIVIVPIIVFITVLIRRLVQLVF